MVLVEILAQITELLFDEESALQSVWFIPCKVLAYVRSWRLSYRVSKDQIFAIKQSLFEITFVCTSK